MERNRANRSWRAQQARTRASISGPTSTSSVAPHTRRQSNDSVKSTQSASDLAKGEKAYSSAVQKRQMKSTNFNRVKEETAVSGTSAVSVVNSTGKAGHSPRGTASSRGRKTVPAKASWTPRARGPAGRAKVTQRAAEPTGQVRSVLVFGSISMDMLANVSTYPTRNVTVAAQSYDQKPGGKGANEAVAVARLGVSVHLVGRVGKDLFGDGLLSHLAREQIDCKGVGRDSVENTGVAMITSAIDRTGKNTVACLGANAACGPSEVKAAAAIFGKEPKIDTLLMQNEANRNAVVDIARLAQSIGKRVIFKASPLFRPGDMQPGLFPLLHTLIVNENEAPILLGWTDDARFPLRKLSDCRAAATALQVKHVLPVVIVVTAFGMTCRVAKDPVTKRPDWFLVPMMFCKVVDIVGAADAAVGGLTAALARQLPLRYALIWATCCGTISTQSAGAQDSMPNMQQLMKFMLDRGINVAPQMLGGGGGDGSVAFGTPPWPAFASRGWLENSELVSEICNAYSHSCSNVALRELLEDFVDNESATGHSFENVRDFQGMTLLHLAVIMSDLNTVCVVLEQGGYQITGLRDRYGRTPLDRAYEYWESARGDTKSRFALIIGVLMLAVWLRAYIRGGPGHGGDIGVYGLATICSPYKGNRPMYKAMVKGDIVRMLMWTLAKSKEIEIVRSDKDNATAVVDDDGVDELSKQRRIGASRIRSKMFQPGENAVRDLAFTCATLLCTKVLGNREKGEHLVEPTVGDGTNELERPGSAISAVSHVSHESRTESGSHEGHVGKEEVGKGAKKSISVADNIRNRMNRVPDPNGLNLEHCIASVGGGGALLSNLHAHGVGGDDPPRQCSRGRSALHYGAIVEDRETCRVLIEAGMSLQHADDSGLTPVDLCQTTTFRNVLLGLGKYRDLFISYGHHSEVTPFVVELNKELKSRDISTWVDMDIQQGERWREAIQDAIKLSGALLVVLSKKWISSNYCMGEANVAMTLGKPIFVLTPPVSEDEKAGFRNLPVLLKKGMSERQFFKTFADPAKWEAAVKELTDALHGNREKRDALSAVAVTSRRGSISSSALSKKAVTESRPERFAAKSGGRPVGGTPGYVFVACGGQNGEKHFAHTLREALCDDGNDVHVGVVGNAYPLLRQSIRGAKAVILVIVDDDDQKFLNRVLQEASETARPILAVPYHQAKGSDGGMGYAAASAKKLKTVCFTDWVGDGLAISSPVFHSIFSAHLKAELELITKPSGWSKLRKSVIEQDPAIDWLRTERDRTKPKANVYKTLESYCKKVEGADKATHRQHEAMGVPDGVLELEESYYAATQSMALKSSPSSQSISSDLSDESDWGDDQRPGNRILRPLRMKRLSKASASVPAKGAESKACAIS